MPATNLLAATARGRVYHDRNGNGQFDAGEPGVGGVRVSNGVDIAVTDADGNYQIRIEEEGVLFVIKPRDWMTAVDSLNLPRFSYIHRPKGTPDQDFIFKGVGPTGPLPESVDFPLYPQPEPDTFEVMLVGDPQTYHTQDLSWYARSIVPAFRRSGAQLAIMLGDLVGDNLDLFTPYNEINATGGLPIYNVLGNHDMNYMALTDRYSDATFERTYGPSTYAFQRGKVHFIILNNVYWNGFLAFRRDGWPRRGGYEGRIRPEQMTFIANYLAEVPRDERIVLCSHIPLVNPYSDSPGAATAEFQQLMALLSSHPHTLSFSGHTHVNDHFLAGPESGYQPEEGTLHLHYNAGTASGSWYQGPRDENDLPFATMRDGTPRGYAVVRFVGSDYTIHYQPFDRPAAYQMLIHLPDVVVVGAETTVQANIFNASRESVVRMRVAGQADWWPMVAERLQDPAYVALYERREAEKAALPDAKLGSLPKPAVSDHHYVAALPALEPGVYRIEVETTDRYGQTFLGQRSVRVVAQEADWDAWDANNIRVARPRPAFRRPTGTAAMPEVIAHRGASYLAPENTLAAIRLAWEQGADAVEFDVHLSADGQIVLHHDRSTRRITGVHRPVAEQTLAELRQQDMGAWKSARWAGESIPTLAEALAEIPAGKRAYVEVKSGVETLPELERVFKASGLEREQLILISFSAQVVAAFKQRMPEYRAYWISSFRQDKDSGAWSPTLEEVLAQARATAADGVSLRAIGPVLDPAWVPAIHDAGLALSLWTINEPALAGQMLEHGARAIVTDRPGWLREHLAPWLAPVKP